MKKELEVAMLPTEDRTSKIWFHNNTKKLLFDPIGVMNCTSQHLYITVSQEVIGGKEVYYIDKFTNKVTSSGGAEYGENQDVIIATTDPKLKTEKISYKIGTVIDRDPIPQLQQSFLKEFVANPDGEWEVEYETKTLMKPADVYVEEVKTKLKLNQDNTVNITSVEEKMYSLSDLERLGDYAYMNAKSTWDWKKFIKENL